MYNLSETYEIVLQDVLDAGLNPQPIVNVTVNHRAKKRLGQCSHRRDFLGNRVHDINISAFMLQDNVKEQELKNVIAHEILHAIPGCNNHKEPWKEAANILMGKFPQYTITRTKNIASTGAVVEQREKQLNYVFRCEKCGRLIGRERKSKFTRHPEWFIHKQCGGHFERVKTA